MAPLRQMFRQHAAHVVVVEIEYDDRAFAARRPAAMSSGVKTWALSSSPAGSSIGEYSIRVHRAPVAITTRSCSSSDDLVDTDRARCRGTVRHSSDVSSWPSRQSSTRPQAASPGKRVSKRSRPPKVVCGFGQRHRDSRAVPRLAHTRGPPGRRRRPAPPLAAATRSKRSGCQPRRHSSPTVGFCVQRTGTLSCQLEMQMLQPMHSRISCSRPSLILRGRKGSAIDGRAPPMRSRTPRRICDTIVSGEVKRPTPTTGLRRQALDEIDHRLVAAFAA